MTLEQFGIGNVISIISILVTFGITIGTFKNKFINYDERLDMQSKMYEKTNTELRESINEKISNLQEQTSTQIQSINKDIVRLEQETKTTNELIQRMAKVEENLNSINKRLDNIEHK